MQSTPRTIVVLGTGGTIAGRAESPDEHVAYTSAVLPVAQLLAALPRSDAALVSESEQVAQVDSKDMDFAIWRRLAEAVCRHLARPEVCGVVITHGTDTLEETAYFLARVVAATKPVVLTAAMRPASSAEADGPRNLADAIVVAAQGGEPGVVVVLAGRVHQARAVRKLHPSRLDAFSSGDQGPIAEVVAGSVRPLRAASAEAPTIGLATLPEDPAAWPWVEIVTGVAGADGRAVDLLVQGGVAGIVVAATGNGTLHRRLEQALIRARARGVAVLRSTRCLDGSIAATEGDLLATAGDLTPVQARVELILTLLRAVALPPASGPGA
jgi:L-asparaginase